MEKNFVLFNKMLVIGILVLFIGICANPSIGTIVERVSNSPITIDNTLYVGGSGLGNYSSIQDAVDYSNPGDTVFVLDDSSPYFENIVVNKSINLFGENKDTTIIDGMKKSYTIDIQANDVHIKGFTIKNASRDLPNAPSGIWCYSYEGYSWDNLHIEHNIITDNRVGINFLRSHNSKISDNIIKSNDNIGLHIWLSEDFICQRNEITGHSNNPLFCLKTPNSDISYNIITGNTGGLHIAFRCNNSLISNNIVIDNGPSWPYGLDLFMTSNVVIRNNIFKNNAWWEIFVGNSSSNMIYHNDIYGIPADDSGYNTWDDGYPSGGNYWSGYNGEDADGDGIGDKPYTFPFGEDRYPLMEPYNVNWNPYARFSYLEDKYNVSFNASSSYDFHGSIVSYEWNFGDGKTGEGETISHDYNEPGRYEVTLKVTDDDGTTDTTSWEVLLYPISNLIPDLYCEGNLIWEDVKHGETIEDSFIIKNIGDPGSLLDWEIIECPEWGIWSFNPDSGTDLLAGETVNITVEIVAPNEGETVFSGEVILVNSEDSDDTCSIDVELTTPRNRRIQHQFLLRLLERFPLLEKLLNLLR